MKKVILFAGKEKSLQRKHPWLFSGAIQKKNADLQEGDLVEVYSSGKDFLAKGYWQNETIAVKILSFEKEDINQEFFDKRVASAVEYRRFLGLLDKQDNTIFRLINAEGDNLPGLIVDYYDGNIVLQFHSVGMYLLKDYIITSLLKYLPETRTFFSKSSSTLGRNKSIEAKDEFLYISKEITESKEPLPDYFIGLENGMKFLIDYKEGQKTGFFIDQAANRKLVSELSKDKKVLNCFSYTGGFSVSALKGGALEVESVDISDKACRVCEQNVEINGLSERHRVVKQDVLSYLNTVADDEYDIIVLDPPAFAKHNRDLQKALKGYRSINLSAMLKIKKGGFLFTFSCSQAVSSQDFFTMLFSCAVLSGRKVRMVKRLTHNFDHPQNIFHSEGEYLKGALLYIE